MSDPNRAYCRSCRHSFKGDETTISKLLDIDVCPVCGAKGETYYLLKEHTIKAAPMFILDKPEGLGALFG